MITCRTASACYTPPTLTERPHHRFTDYRFTLTKPAERFGLSARVGGSIQWLQNFRSSNTSNSSNDPNKISPIAAKGRILCVIAQNDLLPWPPPPEAVDAPAKFAFLACVPWKGPLFGHAHLIASTGGSETT